MAEIKVFGVICGHNRKFPPHLNWPDVWVKRLPPSRGKLSAVRLTDEGGGRRRKASQGFKTAPSSAPVCTLGHLTLSPLAFGHHPYPFWPSAISPDRGNRPLDKGSRPLWGEGLGSVQIGRNLVLLMGQFGYIYWELGRSAPVGRRAAQCAAPTAETW